MIRATMSDSPLFALRKLTKAWIRKDAMEMSAWLTDDVTEIGPAFGAALSGRQDFLRKYQGHFDSKREIADYRIVRPKVVRLTSKLALMYFDYTMQTVSGRAVRDSRGKESVLAEKIRGRWKIRFIHWHEDAGHGHTQVERLARTPV